MKILFDPEALIEATESAVFYEQQQPGLGDAFIDTLDMMVRMVGENPLLWPALSRTFRRCLLPRFPYGIIYAIQGDIIYIAAVMHLKRKPGYWKRRVV